MRAIFSAAFLVDRHFHAVDLVVLGGHRLGERGVAVHQRPDGLADLLFHQSAHLQHARADILELGVVLAGDMRVDRFHGACS
jgi:hypothetical protein